jgi:hypothetical protein
VAVVDCDGYEADGYAVVVAVVECEGYDCVDGYVVLPPYCDDG